MTSAPQPSPAAAGEPAFLISRRELDEAAERLAPHAHRTPVLTSHSLDRRFGAELHFKCENFQRVGAFKFRGAYNAIAQLEPGELERGVCTHSSGNHAQAVSLAARLCGARARVVMPDNAPRIKIAGVRAFGGEITFCRPGLANREAATEKIIAETGAVLIHPYDDRRIIAGQATVARELFEQVPDLGLVLPPLGGGGLVSGTALAARYYSPATRVVAVEPAGADDAYRSLREGRILPSIEPRTIADGLLSSLGELTFEIIRHHVERVVTVDDAAIVDAMRLLWERLKIVVEPSAAVPFAALVAGEVDAAGKKVGIILSGGNVDLDRLPWNRGEER